MQDYLQQIKILADKLAACWGYSGGFRYDYPHPWWLPCILSILQDTAVNTWSMTDPVTLDELHTLLICEELNLEEAPPKTPLTEPYTAFIALRNSTNHGNQRGSSNNRGCDRGHGGSNRGGYNNSTSQNQITNSTSQNQNSSSNRSTFRICNRMGHFEIDCYHRIDYAYQGHHPPKKLMAMVANQSPMGDQTWYSDTGASHHVTSDFG